MIGMLAELLGVLAARRATDTSRDLHHHAPADTVTVGVYLCDTCRCGAHRVAAPHLEWVSGWSTDPEAGWWALGLRVEARR